MPPREANHLCLRCRKSGHILTDCSSTVRAIDPPYPQSLPSKESRLARWGILKKDESLCARCKKIGLSWSAVADESSWNVLNQRDKLAIKLGLAATAVFRKDCPLCILLFEVTPDPGEQGALELVVVMTFTLTRLGQSRYSPAVLERKDMRWTECLYTTLKDYRTTPALCMHASNAFCPLDDKEPRVGKFLPGRIVPDAGVEFELVRGGIERCEAQHGKRCESERSEELRSIRLIDVNLRKIVNYPSTNHTRYFALSYMWGDASQQSYDLGDVLDQVCQTIEDVIEVTKRVGVNYLWVDSICINQESESHKESQIPLMGSIYNGSWATIVTLSRSDASFGLCRVNPLKIKSSHANDETYHILRSKQIVRNIRGERFVTTLPTLDQQIRKSRWRYRGWTLQEALLAPRCIFFSCDQVYFQCNIIQCCESLDDTKNPVFPTERSSLSEDAIADRLNDNTLMEDYPTGNLINPFTAPPDPIDTQNQRSDVALFKQLRLYDRLLEDYSGRRLGSPSDAIAAFSAILSRFRERFGCDIFGGLPSAALPWTLLWEEESYENSRNPLFPSWSWAGWQGTLSRGQYPIQNPDKIYAADNPEPFLHTWKVERGEAVKFEIFEAELEEYDLRRWNWVISNMYREPPRTDDIDLSCYPNAESQGLLLIDGIILRMMLNWSPPRRNRHGQPKWDDYTYTHLEPLFGNIKSPRLPPEKSKLGRLRDMVGKTQDFLIVLGKDIADHPAEKTSAVFLSLLLLRWEGEVARRVAVMHVRIDGYVKDDIMKCEPRRRRFLLG